MNRILDPDANIFVGDLLDGGREWEDDKWYEEFKRFNRIFSGHKAKTIMSLPGNHDIGFGNTIVEHALKRFEREFGTPSSTVDLFGHTFVLADTISMMNTQNETVFQPPFKFLEAIEEKAGDKRILLTHVPLYRPKGTSCGPLRESGEALRYIRGYQYETMVTPKLTQELLRRVKPIAIFSGDDHDACEVEHRYPADDGECIAQEYIVKSASMAMGIRHPAIELVTLDNGDGKGDKKGDSRSYHASICYLPDPFYAFALYFVAAVSTGMLLGAFAVYPGLVPRVLARSDHPGTHSFLPVKRDDALGDDSSSEVNRGRLLLKGLVKDGAKVAIAPALFYLYLEWSMMH
ncbi:cell division control protein 1 [Trichomonascus vanleenenianus]|uniref:cell division control protein 1 n=1 Tax=Trichomonascus vanleenenianus TaxID=2268995 RepID=UPI003ECA07BC